MFALFFLFLLPSIFCATEEDTVVFQGASATWYLLNQDMQHHKTHRPGLHVFCVKPKCPKKFRSMSVMAFLYYNVAQHKWNLDPTEMPKTIIWGNYSWDDDVNYFDRTYANSNYFKLTIHTYLYEFSYKHPLPVKPDHFDLTLTASPPSTDVMSPLESAEETMRYEFRHSTQNDPLFTVTLTASHRNPGTIQVCTNNGISWKFSAYSSMDFHQETRLSPFVAYKGAHASWMPLPKDLTEYSDLEKFPQEVRNLANKYALTGVIIAYCPQTLKIAWKDKLTCNLACIFHTKSKQNMLFKATAQKQDGSENPALNVTITQIDSCGPETFLTQTLSELTSSDFCGFNHHGLRKNMQEEYAICPLPSQNTKACLEIICNISGTCAVGWNDGQIKSITCTHSDNLSAAIDWHQAVVTTTPREQAIVTSSTLQYFPLKGTADSPQVELNMDGAENTALFDFPPQTRTCTIF